MEKTGQILPVEPISHPEVLKISECFFWWWEIWGPRWWFVWVPRIGAATRGVANPKDWWVTYPDFRHPFYHVFFVKKNG